MEFEEIEITKDQYLPFHITVKCARCGTRISVVSAVQQEDSDEVEIQVDPHLCWEYQSQKKEE